MPYIKCSICSEKARNARAATKYEVSLEPWRTIFRRIPIAVLLLAGCASEPSLDAEQTKGQASPTSPEFAEACLIATTGADRHGVPLPKEALRAIRAELKDKKVDCPKAP